MGNWSKKFSKVLTAAGISAIIAVSSIALPIEAFAARTVTDNVMIRNEPSTEGGIIGSLNEGDEVTILDVMQSGRRQKNRRRLRRKNPLKKPPVRKRPRPKSLNPLPRRKRQLPRIQGQKAMTPQRIPTRTSGQAMSRKQTEPSPGMCIMTTTEAR